MLINVLTRFAADTGIHPDQKRNLILQKLNTAAKEMYDLLDCNKIHREVTVLVPRDKVVSLPSFIGELRGMRTSITERPFDISSMMSPRYISDLLHYRFRNWRDLGDSPIHTLPSSIGNLTIEPLGVEITPVTVKISGQTNNAARVEESIVVDDVTQETTNLFGPSLFAITCMAQPRQYNILVKDEAGNELATLYNTDNSSRYKVIDVSQFSWPADTAAEETLIDVCYKVKYTQLVNDTDSFFAGDDYDEAWYNMAMHVFLDPLANRKDEGLSFRAKAMTMLTVSKDAAERGQTNKFSFGSNKYYDLFRNPYTEHYPYNTQ